MNRYITVTHGMRGWFSVLVETDKYGYEEPVMSSPLTSATREDAIKDAKSWAQCENLKFKE